MAYNQLRTAFKTDHWLHSLESWDLTMSEPADSSSPEDLLHLLFLHWNQSH